MANNLLVQNTYFTAQQFVDPVQFSTPQPALVDEKLLFPIIKNAADYQVAIGKASVPLENVPLTNSNIPLKRYEVILRQGSLEGSAYLRQVNANNSDFVWNCTPAGVVTQFIYQATGSLQVVTTINCSSFVPNGVEFFLVDDYKNAYFATSTLPGGYSDVIKIVNLTDIVLLNSEGFTHIKGMDLDRSNTLYVADEAPSGSAVKVFENNNSAESVSLTLIETITQDLSGNALTEIRTVAADQSLLVGYATNKFCIYSITSYLPVSGFTNADIFQMGKASAINSSGQGTFCVTDTGFSDEFFVGATTPASGNNSLNLLTNTTYEPTATWLPQSKFVLATDSGFGFAIGSDTRLYAFTINSSYAPTGSPFVVNSLPVFYNLSPWLTYTNVVCGYTTSSGEYLGGLNLNQESPPTNTVQTFQTDFRVGGIGAGSVPIAFDFQTTTNKCLAVYTPPGSTSNSLALTSQPLYPKNFVNFALITESPGFSNFARFGVGWNTSPGVATPTISGTASMLSGIFIDGFQQFDGSNIVLCTSNGFNTYNINGSPLNPSQFNTTELGQIIGCCSTGAADRVAIIDSAGKLAVYNTDTGALTDGPIALALTGLEPYIFGGYDAVNSIFFIVIGYGETIYVYTSANGSTSYDQSFYNNNTTIPTGATQPNWFYSGDVLNSGNSAVSPTIAILCSGTNTTPGIGTAQALCKLQFNADYSALSSAIMYADGQFLAAVNNSSLSGSSDMGEFYIQGSGGITANYRFSGTLTTVSGTSFAVTSTATFPGTASTVPAPFFPVVTTKNNGYYTWQTVTTTGASSFNSVAFSHTHPNTVYALDTLGAVWKGTLNGTSIAFSVYPRIATNANLRSISAFDAPESYSSTVRCYSISNQQQVGSSVNYANQLVSSIGKNDVSQNFVIAVQNSQLQFASSTTFTGLTSASLPSANLVFSKAGEDVDAGKAPIYDFQVFINALNAAFLEAKARLGGTLVTAPQVTMDYQTQLFTMTYSSDFTLAGNGILFNPALWRIVQFYYKPDTVDVGFYRIQLPLNSTSVVQTHKSAYLFNKLKKILFQSNTIYVAGSFQGINAQNQVITDIDVITDGYIDNQGQVLYFQPNILRPYQMASNNSVDRIQLRVLYEYVDGEQNQLLVSPDSGFSALLDFIKRS
jgi:hypothetical protein